MKNVLTLESWKDMADKLIKLNHHNILRPFSYEEDVDNG